jgi:hypothetical protein
MQANKLGESHLGLIHLGNVLVAVDGGGLLKKEDRWFLTLDFFLFSIGCQKLLLNVLG